MDLRGISAIAMRTMKALTTIWNDNELHGIHKQWFLSFALWLQLRPSPWPFSISLLHHLRIQFSKVQEDCLRSLWGLNLGNAISGLKLIPTCWYMYENFLHHESGMPPWIESSKLNNEFLEEDDCERNARRREREGLLRLTVSLLKSWSLDKGGDKEWTGTKQPKRNVVSSFWSSHDAAPAPWHHYLEPRLSHSLNHHSSRRSGRWIPLQHLLLLLSWKQNAAETLGKKWKKNVNSSSRQFL